jgi:hypothetical protein
MRRVADILVIGCDEAGNFPRKLFLRLRVEHTVANAPDR